MVCIQRVNKGSDGEASEILNSASARGRYRENLKEIWAKTNKVTTHIDTHCERMNNIGGMLIPLMMIMMMMITMIKITVMMTMSFHTPLFEGRAARSQRSELPVF